MMGLTKLTPLDQASNCFAPWSRYCSIVSCYTSDAGGFVTLLSLKVHHHRRPWRWWWTLSGYQRLVVDGLQPAESDHRQEDVVG